MAAESFDPLVAKAEQVPDRVDYDTSHRGSGPVLCMLRSELDDGLVIGAHETLERW